MNSNLSPTTLADVDAEKFLNKQLERFQKELKLEDWNIRLNFVLKPGRPGAIMEVHFTPGAWIASIRVNKEKLRDLTISQATYCIIHELTHLVVDNLCREDVSEVEIEEVVDTLSILIHRGR